MPKQRDPHLPPPAVVDWLLTLEWSSAIPEKVITYPTEHPKGTLESKHYGIREASCALGRDEIIDLEIASEALEVMRADWLLRQVAKLEKGDDIQPFCLMP